LRKDRLPSPYPLIYSQFLQHSMTKISSKTQALTLAAIIVIGGIFAVTNFSPVEAGQATITICGQQGHPNHPADPLEVSLTQHTKNDKFRTIIVEKEEFHCDRENETSFIREITVIIEKIENKFGKDLSTTITVIQCDKEALSDPINLVPTCTIVPIEDTVNFVACNEDSSFMEMASISFPTTVGGNPTIVDKYVIVEKEILLCGFDPEFQIPNRVFEVFVLEEIVNQVPTITQHTIICEKDIIRGTMIACQDFGTSIIT